MKKEITPKDIYNFYLIEYYLNRANKKIKNKSNILSFLLQLKESYTTNLHSIIVNQIKKYIKRGRIDSDLDYVSSSDSYDDLLNKMKKTYRSDMKRRNVEWENIVDSTIKLSEAFKTIKDLIFNLDRVNNAVHNTGESVLSKIGNNLLNAFDEAHKGDIAILQNKGDFDKIKQWFDNVGDNDKKSTYMRSRWGVYESNFDKYYSKIIKSI